MSDFEFVQKIIELYKSFTFHYTIDEQEFINEISALIALYNE